MFDDEMFGRLLAGLVVVGLAFGVWILLTPEKTGNSVATVAAPTTTTTAESSTSTSAPETTTTSVVETSGVIETVEEAEALLREFWFGWFEGIYNQDEERIKEVVASERLLANAMSQFGVMEFEREPNRASLEFTETEVLKSNETCVVIWTVTLVPFRGGSTDGVHVFRYDESNWKAISIWSNPEDLWEQDCDTQLEPLP